MTIDRTGVGDQMVSRSATRRRAGDSGMVRGHGTYRLLRPDGTVKQTGTFTNIITEVGDQVYGERGGGVTSPPDAPTGMRLGTGTTAPAKTGAGAAIVTYISGSAKAFTTAAASSLESGKRRITYVTSWAAGEATANDIAEAVITNEASITDVSGSAANTTARALVSPTVNKGADDTLEITWHNDIGTV